MAGPGPVGTKPVVVPPATQQSGAVTKAGTKSTSPFTLPVLDETKLGKRIDEAFSRFDLSGLQRTKSSASSRGSQAVSNTKVEDNAGPERTVTVRDRRGNAFQIEFTPNPKSSKRIIGDHALSRNAMISMIQKKGKMAEWDKLDKHDINGVKKFMDRMNLSTEDKVKFVNNYLTSFYNHPGKDIAWRGNPPLQDAINAVPVDKQGRKYLDCEGYTRLAGHLLGESKVNHYALDAEGSGGRDHQVAVFREGGKAYVINNNQITKVDASNSDADAIREAHPGHKDIVRDTSGPMAYGTEMYKKGQSIHGSIPHAHVDRIVDPKTMIGQVNDPRRGSYHIKISVDPGTGRLSRKMDLRAGNELRDTAGNTITITKRNPDGTYQAMKEDSRGRFTQVCVTVTPKGDNWSWR
ncbi:MAG: hypothetical protein AB1714_18795 [Acidobacteriota bacterium]